jgi:hypothetical protein
MCKAKIESCSKTLCKLYSDGADFDFCYKSCQLAFSYSFNIDKTKSQDYISKAPLILTLYMRKF